MIVVDASALVAIGADEPDKDVYVRALMSDECVISNINYVETGIILISRSQLMRKPEFDQWMSRLGVAIRQTDDLAEPALEAYLKFGRGFHRARLNLADCFAYALASRLGAPLLYKGDDFTFTDVRRVRQPT
jgi:ribonuclease VapC